MTELGNCGSTSPGYGWDFERLYRTNEIVKFERKSYGYPWRNSVWNGCDERKWQKMQVLVSGWATFEGELDKG